MVLAFRLPSFPAHFIGSAAFPGTQYQIDDIFNAFPILDFGEDCRTAFPVLKSVGSVLGR